MLKEQNSDHFYASKKTVTQIQFLKERRNIHKKKFGNFLANL